MERKGDWTAFRRVGDRSFVGCGDYDGDDLLGLILNSLGGRTLAPLIEVDETDEEDSEVVNLENEEDDDKSA